jgi:large subunit ribosomal protein L17
MRHRKHTAKLGRTGTHRNAMLANLVCSLIQHKRITTTLAKAKAARPVAEKMVTFGKNGTIHDRRLAAARLRHHSKHMLRTKEAVAKARENDVIRILFSEIAPAFKERQGGYTRIIKLHQRRGDAAQLAILEWVEDSFKGGAETKTETKAESRKTEEAPSEESKSTGENQRAETK